LLVYEHKSDSKMLLHQTHGEI